MGINGSSRKMGLDAGLAISGKGLGYQEPIKPKAPIADNKVSFKVISYDD